LSHPSLFPKPTRGFGQFHKNDIKLRDAVSARRLGKKQMWPISRFVALVVSILIGSALAAPVNAAGGAAVPAEADVGHQPNIFVEQQTDCMEIADIKAALASVLDSREESPFMIVTVVVSPTVGGSLAVLRVIERETGEILLEKSLNIVPEECADAHLVLKVMLEQFFTGFPIQKWKEKQAPSPPEPVVRTERVVVDQEVMPLHWMLLMGVDSRWPTPSGSLEFGLGVGAGARHHGVIGHVLFRAGWPHPLGDGRFLETAALLALGWRFSASENRQLRLEVRAGAVRVSGLGYEKNYSQWLILLEAQLSLLWRLGSVYLGPELGISPLFHSVHTVSGDHEDLPWLRVGILLGVPLWKSRFR
jgi:hypothetical protein